MDAFSIVVGFAAIAPAYFYDCMDWREFLAIGQAYREDWEKTRLLIETMGGTLNLPWGKDINPARPKKPTGYNKNKALSVARALQNINISNN